MLTWLIEAEKFYNLPSASWRARKASDVIQFKFKGLKIRELMF